MKTKSIMIGGALLAAAVVGVYAYNEFNKGRAMARSRRHAMYGTAGSRIQHHPKSGDERYAARLARKYSPTPGQGDSGITNVAQYDSGGVLWHGWAASPWSPLTAKNENYTYSHPPTNRLLKPGGAGALEHMKLQGATGLTKYLPGITYTYW